MTFIDERPRKVHLIADQSAHRQPNGRRYADTICKHNTRVELRTTDPRKVTCKSCLKVMGREKYTPTERRYAEAMRDSRTLRWTRADALNPSRLPLGKTYIGALLLEPEQVWALFRVQWCENCGHWEVAQATSELKSDHTAVPVTHIAEDVLGVPSLR